MGLSMKYNLLGIIGLVLISAIALSTALPVVANASAIIRLPSLSQQTNTTVANTTTAFGVEALIAVLEFSVKKIKSLFVKWNITDNESWSELEEINESISEVKKLLDEGNISDARRLAVELLQELAKLVKDTVMAHSNVTKNMSREQLKLMIRIHAMNKTIEVLFNASTKLEAMNKTIAAIYNDTLVQARTMLHKALRLVLENNTSVAEELLDKAREMIEKAREILRETVMVRVKEHVREHVDKMIKELNKTITMLEELAQKLEQDGLTYAAQAVYNTTERLKNMLQELLNTTKTLVDETIPPGILAKMYENMIHDIKEIKHHAIVTEDYAEKAKKIHGSFRHVDDDKANLTMIMNAMKNMASMLPSQARIKLNALNAKMNELDQAIRELQESLQTCNRTLVEQMQEKVLAKIDEMKQLVDELRASINYGGDNSNNNKGKHQKVKPFMNQLDRMEQALTEMREEVKSVIHEVLEETEECKETIINASTMSLKELEEKINNTIKMLKECKHRSAGQVVQIKMRLEEAYRLIAQARIALQKNNTNLALKLLAQAKNKVEESPSLERHMPRYIKDEIKRIELMIEALIEQLED